MYSRASLGSEIPIRDYPDGVSVVVCCHNSTHRLSATLKALAEQEVHAGRCWEIVLVDNASSDGTAIFAKQVWQLLDPPVSLQVVKEQVPGLRHARLRGIAAAQFGFILFCDDDNWLSPGYVENVYQTLKGDQGIAACGGRGIPHFESVKPVWFDLFQEAFATGPQGPDPYSKKTISLYGAGLGLNRQTFNLIEASGYCNTQTGRMGQALSSSEDIEMTNAFVLLGFELRYLNTLTFIHFLPAARTDRKYLGRLFVAFGDDGPIRNLLYAAISNRKLFWPLKWWGAHFLLSLLRLIKYLALPPKPGARRLYFNWNRAYIRNLWGIRKQYQAIRENIARLTHFRQRREHSPVNLKEPMILTQR